MNCNQCGREIPGNSIFCPFCGTPQKAASSYDSIEGEIGANVDKIKKNGASGKSGGAKKSRNDAARNDMYKTRNVYGSDTIYENRSNTSRYVADTRRRDYRDSYDDYDYDDDYEYEYEDWGMESGGGNKGVIITTIIIAIICLAGIAAIIYFGLKPQEKGTATDVVRIFNTQNVEVSEGEEFEGKLEVALLSEQGYEIHYTVDGSDVNIKSPVYQEHIIIDKPGTVEIKAQSFDAKGNPSGNSIAKTLVIVEALETETTTEETTKTTEAAITKEEAEEIVEKALIENGAMMEDYSTENGGFINLIHAGETTIGDVDYYVIQADYYDAEGSIWETSYYGVENQIGNLFYLEKQDGEYTIVE